MTEFRSSPQPRSKLFDWYFVAAILGAAILLFATLLLPLGFDNDVYQSMGWTLWAYHGLPYLASWDMNFPGIVFIHAASIALFGSSDFGFRLFDYLTHIVMAGMFYVVLRRWLRPRTSFIAVILWAIYYTSGLWGLAGQRDTYAVFFLLAGTLLIFSMRKNGINGYRAFTLGIVLGCATLIRPTYALFFLSFLWLVFNLPGRFKGIAYLIAGCLSTCIIVLLPYFFIRGGIEEIYYSVIRFNLDVYARIPVEISFFFRRNGLLYALCFIGIYFALLRNSPARHNVRNHLSMPTFDRTFLYLMMASSIISPVVMRKFFSYHLEPFMTIVSAFAAIGLATLSELPHSRWFAPAIATFGILLFAFIVYPRHLIKYYIEALQTAHPLEATYRRADSDSLSGVAAQQEVVRYVDRNTLPSEAVESVSVFPALRWRLARKSATRFTTLVPLVPPPSFRAPYLEDWQHEFVATLALVRPSFIILNRSEEWWPFIHTYAAQAPHLIPGFDSLIAANYKLDTVIRGFILYRPKS
jgi:hypothetical protein